MDKTPQKSRVFLSYNSRDREIVEQIAQGLQQQGLDVFFDRWSLPVGHPWPEELERALRDCHGVVVFFGQQALGPWQQKESSLALHRQTQDKSFPVVPVLLAGSDPPLSFLTLNTWIDWRGEPAVESLDSLTAKLIDALHGREAERKRKRTKRTQGKRGRTQPLAASPYRGLLPFREVDASFFCGRESFVPSLRAAVEKNNITALVGPSGSGKSSVVHAGLLPALRSETSRFWQAISLRPGPHPISSLATALCRLLEPGLSSDEQKSSADRLTVALLHGQESLESLAGRAHDHSEKDGLLLLVVDQWEELYTLAQDNQKERDQFIEQVLAATLTSSISILIVFRSDFFSHVTGHAELRRALQGDRLIQIPDMSREDMRRAVEEPAKKVGLRFDDGLVERILDDIGRQPGQLSLLEYVLTRLWDERKDRRLLISSYDAMGGLEGALTRRADEILSRLSEAEVRRLFLRLVRVERDSPVTRRRASMGELDRSTLEVASPFVESRLLVTGWDAKTGDEVLEVAHEALIRHWGRLRDWLEKNRSFLLWREELEPDLAAWSANDQRESFLLTAGPLQVAEYWFQKNGTDLSPEAQGFILLSMEKKERDHARRRFRRLGSVSVVTLLILMLTGVAARMLYLRSAQTSARSAALAAESLRLSDQKLDLALLLALQANEVRNTAESRGAVLSLIAGSPGLRRFLRPPAPRSEATDPAPQEERSDEILATASGPGGLVASGANGKVFLWDANQGTLKGVVETGFKENVVWLALNRDGALLAAGSKSGLVRIWNLSASGAEPVGAGLIQADGSSQNLVFSPAGNLLAWSTPKGIYAWDLLRKAFVWQIPRMSVGNEEDWISGLALGANGGVASATADGQILYRASGSEKPLWSTKTEGHVFGVGLPSDQKILVSAGTLFQRWRIQDGRPVGSPCRLSQGPGDEIISVTFSRDWRIVASAHFDHKIRLWDVTQPDGCRLVGTLSGHSGLIWSLAFADRQGDRLPLISGGQEGELLLWDAAPSAQRFSSSLLSSSPEGKTILAASRDGNLLAVADSSDRLTLLDGMRRKVLDVQALQSQHTVEQMAFSQDGQFLAIGDNTGAVSLWEVQEHRLVPRGMLTLAGNNTDTAVQSLAFGPEEPYLAIGTKAGAITVWRVGERATLVWHENNAQSQGVQALAFAEQAGVLISGGGDGTLSLWSSEKGKRLQVIAAAHSLSVRGIAVRADGLVATGSPDGNARLWKLDGDIRPEGTLFLGGSIWDLALSNGGNLLAATLGGDNDHKIVLWDLERKIPLGRDYKTQEKIESVAFDPEGTMLYMAGQGVASWWDLRPATWISRACDMVQRSLDPVEQSQYLRPSEQPFRCDQRMQKRK